MPRDVPPQAEHVEQPVVSLGTQGRLAASSGRLTLFLPPAPGPTETEGLRDARLRLTETSALG